MADMKHEDRALQAHPGAPRGKANVPDRSLLLDLHEQMVLLRKFELAVQLACRQGKTPGFLHLYLGQEATGVGVCAHLRKTDWITSTHRGHGHALAKGVDPRLVMAELFGRRDGICGGRGGTMHLYYRPAGLFGTNGIVAAGIGHAVGAGLSARIRGTDAIGVAFFGDGATSHGSFHESLNFAAVQRAPVVFVCENNLFATETPIGAATLNPDIAARAGMYGIAGIAVDGNDVLAVWQAMQEASDRARGGGGATLIEAQTYRMAGHYEGDPLVGAHRTQDELDAWARRDPIEMLSNRMVNEYGIASAAELDEIDRRIDAIVADALEFANNSPEPDPADLGRHVLAEPLNPPEAVEPDAAAGTRTQGWLAAVREGIAEEMRTNATIVYYGEGIGERGGSFAHTKGLWQEFGGGRMVDTPISELGFTAAAIGASATGVRAIADLMFADFTFEAMGQIVMQAAKLRYMSNGGMNAPVVIRAGAGALRSSGPHHSGLYHSIFAHMPGLVVCLPSSPADAKGLMKTALRASDPVIMLEPKALFASKGEVPVDEHYVPFGVARIVREGSDITVVATGRLVHEAAKAAEILAGEGISVELIDPRTIMPFDIGTVVESVRKTHRLLIADEGWAMCGLGGEIAQGINELAFDDLDAPVGRLHSAATSHPFAPVLERAMLVDAGRIVAGIRDVIDGRPPVPDHWRTLGRTPAARPAAAPAAAAPAAQAATDKPQASTDSGAEKDRDDEPVTMPFGDLTVSEGTIIGWSKAVGDPVTEGETIAEIETDKAVVEIEAPATGVLTAIDRPVGDTVAMGARIGGVTPAGKGG